MVSSSPFSPRPSCGRDKASCWTSSWGLRVVTKTLRVRPSLLGASCPVALKGAASSAARMNGTISAFTASMSLKRSDVRGAESRFHLHDRLRLPDSGVQGGRTRWSPCCPVDTQEPAGRKRCKIKIFCTIEPVDARLGGWRLPTPIPQKCRGPRAEEGGNAASDEARARVSHGYGAQVVGSRATSPHAPNRPRCLACLI